MKNILSHDVFVGIFELLKNETGEYERSENNYLIFRHIYSNFKSKREKIN
jgi:hypothetical protein